MSLVLTDCRPDARLLHPVTNLYGIMAMKNESPKVQRKTWERPALYRMDAADAETAVNSMTNDGMPNMS